MADPAELLRVAERLDDSPTELLNGGAAEALRALSHSSTEIEEIARARGIEISAVNELWERASQRLRDVPDEEEVFPAAAEAASLLYTAAWVLQSDSASSKDIRDVL